VSSYGSVFHAEFLVFKMHGGEILRCQLFFYFGLSVTTNNMEITQSDSTNIDSAEKTEPEWKSLFTDPDEEDQLPMICGHRAIVYQNFYYVIQGFDGGYTSDCYRYALGNFK
jgi:hypothetical protein